VSRKRVAVLISGGGSNMRALVEASRAADYPAEIVLVLSNKANAGGLEFAHAQNIATAVIDHKAYANREAFDRAIQSALVAQRIELVCLAGFMRLLTPWFVDQWRGRMLNIHPAILPSYKGLHTHERALKDGVKLHGCTVHFVVPEMDEGPIIEQACVRVEDDDTPDTLGARVLREEHRIYPQALALAAANKLRIENGRVFLI
jgi:phosphoribosylglycinamide formyltransferase-1